MYDNILDFIYLLIIFTIRKEESTKYKGIRKQS